MKRTKLRVKGISSASQLKDDIQALVRAIVIKRDGTCILRKLRRCTDTVLQADHLITRSNSATYADTRLIVCLCRSCHGGFKQWHESEYNEIVRSILPKERVDLWDKCMQDMHAHRTKKMDWAIERVALEQEYRSIIK